VPLGVVLSLALAACSQTDATAPAPTPTPGGTLTFATDSQPDCLDPAFSPVDVTALVDRNIFDSLVAMTPEGKAEPWLAEKWTMSPDGKTYRFTLKSGVTFHDGTPFNAEAVKASLDHVVDPKTKSAYAASLISGYTGATVIDDRTVEVSLAKPRASFLASLSTSYLGIQSPKSLRDNAANLCLQPVGSGPFKFVSWTKNADLQLTKNADYNWGSSLAKHTGAARLDGLTIKFIPEASVRFGTLTSGQAQVIGGVPPANVGTLQNSAELQLMRADAPGAVYAMHLNSVAGPLADERVRVALQRSLNIDPLVKSLYFGQYSRAWSLLGPTTVGYDKSTEGSWPYDPGMAGKLLDEAGWTARDADGYRTKDGKRLTLKWPYTAAFNRDQREVLGQGLQADAKKAGIELNYVSEDRGAYVKDILDRNADINGTSFVRAEPDILRYHLASDQLSGKGGGNVFHITDPQLDSWLNDAVASTDLPTRQRLYANVQQELNKRALNIPLYVPAYLLGASKKVHELSFEPNAYPVFYDAWLERAP
jgi:peptide/nickel transport system substrate-binding protein